MVCRWAPGTPPAFRQWILLSPQQVGMIAGQRAVDHLSARGLATRKCPVVFVSTGLLRAYSEPLFMRQAVLRCTARPPSSKEC